MTSSNLFILRSQVSPDGYDRGYPVDQWALQSRLYAEYESHFSGAWLEETVSDTNPDLKYPLQYDPCFLPVMLHSSFLYGEVPDGATALVQPEVEIWEDGKQQDSQKALKSAKKMTDFLRAVWDENGARSKQMQVGVDSQVYGGFVMGAFYDPERTLDGMFPLSILRFDPCDFFPVWRASDYDHLIDVQIAYGITKIQAEDLGVNVDTNLALFREQWTRDHYEITIDDKVITVYGNPGEGKPPGGVIPFVYVPHPPRIGFYGTSLLKNRVSLAKEINANIVSTGDIITEEALNIAAVRNVRNPKIYKLSGTKPVIDLGFQQGDRIPDIIHPAQRATSVDSASKQTEKLISLLRGEMYCPPVLFGDDDGSQRSAASLALRAIPLVTHIRDERALYTAGMERLNKDILRIAAAKGIGGITVAMARSAHIRSSWFPMLPRDVLQEVATYISRVQADILSPETAIQKIGDILDIVGEVRKIKLWKDYNARLKAQPVSNPFTNAGRSGEFGGVETKPSITKE